MVLRLIGKILMYRLIFSRTMNILTDHIENIISPSVQNQQSLLICYIKYIVIAYRFSIFSLYYQILNVSTKVTPQKCLHTYCGRDI